MSILFQEQNVRVGNKTNFSQIAKYENYHNKIVNS